MDKSSFKTDQQPCKTINQYENYEKILALIANAIESSSMNVNKRREKRNSIFTITKYKVFIRKKKYKIKLLSEKVQILTALVTVLLKTKNKRFFQNQHYKNELMHSKSKNTMIIDNFMGKGKRSSKTLNGICTDSQSHISDLEKVRKKYILSEGRNRYLINKLSILENQYKIIYEENKHLRCQTIQFKQKDSFLNKMKGDDVHSEENHNIQQFVTSEDRNINNSKTIRMPVRKFKSHLYFVNFLLSCQKQILYEAQELVKSK